MKYFLLCFFALLLGDEIHGQADVNKSQLTPSMDIYSSYIWRGSMLGTGPAMQPSLVFTGGGFTAGVWGSFDFHGYQEADPYIYYEFDSGLSLGLTDYYYPSLSFTDLSRQDGSHAFEINAGYTFKAFSLTANYILNEAGGAGSAGNDLYFEAGYSRDIMNVFIGAGNGWHTSNGNFNVCNIGIGAVKKISIGENFILPVSAQVVVNPETEKFYVMAGISF